MADYRPVRPTKYYAKAISYSGSVIAEPLEDSGIEFTCEGYVPGQSRKSSFRVGVKDTAGVRWDSDRATTSASLDYRTRIEIYDNRDCRGDPRFTGIVTDLPGDLDRQEIAGAGILDALDSQRLRRYHTLSGNAASLAEDLLKTQNVIFSDGFGSGSGNWTNESGTWNIAACYLSPCSGVDPPIVVSASTYTVAQYDDMRVSCHYKRINANSGAIYLPYQDTNNIVRVYFGTVTTAADQYEQTWLEYAIDGNPTILAIRYLPLTSLSAINHIDIYSAASGTGRKITIVQNGTEIISATASGVSALTGAVGFHGWANEVGSFILSAGNAALTKGTFDATSTSITQTFNADTRLKALEWIAEYLDWEFRVNPKAGTGNDTLDFGATIGTDYSDVVILEEGKNIFSLSQHRTSENLATSLYVYGQKQDDISSNFVSNNLDAFDTYGIIDGEYSDPRVVDVSIAKILGDNRVAITSAGNVSLSGKVLDEFALFEQDPRIGYAIIGDAVIGGRQYLREGDYVWLKSKRLNIDKKVRVVSITRRSGDPAIDLTFDYFAWRKSDEIKRIRRQIDELTRTFNQRMNSQSWSVTFASPNSASWFPYLRGQIHSTLIDISKTSTTGASYALFIDGTNRTTALFGACPVDNADAHANDTNYLTLSGKHTIGIEVTSGSGIFDIALQTRLLG